MKQPSRGRRPGSLRRSPASAEFAKAQRAFSAGRHDECRTLCRQMIKKNTKDAQAHHLLGLSLAEGAQYDKAIASLHRSLKLRPRDPGVHLSMARLFISQGLSTVALSWLDKALRLNRDFEEAIIEKAALLERLGQVDDARSVVAPIGPTPRHPVRKAHVEAAIAFREKDYEATVRASDAFLRDEGAEPIVRRRLLFLRGQALDKLGDPDAAMESWRIANAIMRVPFDPAERRRRVENEIAYFTPERMRKLPRATLDAESPMFIAGMPRSGTTLLEQIFDVHPSATGVGEPRDIEQLIPRLPLLLETDAAYPASLAKLSSAHADAFATAYLQSVGQFTTAETVRTIDKCLRNWRLLGLITLLFPQTRIIYSRRDPVETCLSIYMNEFHPIKYSWTTDLRLIGLVYRQAERLMTHWRHVLEVPMLEVPYEQVISDQAAWSRKLIEFSGLPWNERCLRFYEHDRAVMTLSYAQVAQPIYTSALHRSTRYEAHLRPLLEALDEEA